MLFHAYRIRMHILDAHKAGESKAGEIAASRAAPLLSQNCAVPPHAQTQRRHLQPITPPLSKITNSCHLVTDNGARANLRICSSALDKLSA